MKAPHSSDDSDSIQGAMCDSVSFQQLCNEASQTIERHPPLISNTTTKSTIPSSAPRLKDSHNRQINYQAQKIFHTHTVERPKNYRGNQGALRLPTRKQREVYAIHRICIIFSRSTKLANTKRKHSTAYSSPSTESSTKKSRASKIES
jgi:hypothetical protein